MNVDPSAAGFEELKGTERDATQARAILTVLLEGAPMTAQELGDATKLGAYTVSKRRGYLLRTGCVEEMATRKCLVTGRPAKPLRVTETGRDVADGGEIPAPGPSKRDREIAVLAAARTVARAWDRLPPPPGLQGIVDAVWSLDNHEAQHRGGVNAVREPWGSPRRVRLATQGVWLRRNGDQVTAAAMVAPHLASCIEWCRKNGADESQQPLLLLILESERRGISCTPTPPLNTSGLS